MAHSSLHVLDTAVIVLYLGIMIGMGVYFMRRQRNASEYLLASHDIGWFAIGLSLLSALNSALDYIVGPASYMEWGLILGVGIVSVMLAFPIVFSVFIPFYQRLSIFNCYEYLEHRFDVRVRTTASAIFVLWRICWMAFTIYLPAYALNVVMGMPVLPTILVLGAFTTVYTTIGGIRAVIWTDVVQAIIMFVGLILAIFLAVRGVPDGLAGMWNAARESQMLRVTADLPGWDSASFWDKVSLYLHYPITLWSVIIVNFIGQLNNYGADQVMIQRYLSAKSLKDCQRGFVANAVAYVVYTALFFTLSMALMAFFKHNPIDASVEHVSGKFEFYFPYFIGTQLPPVLKGLILISIYSAAQSSVSAGISAGTSVIYSNFYARFLHGQISVSEDLDAYIERQHMTFNRVCAFGFGAIVTALACLIPYIGEGLFGLANKIVSNFAGVMIPVFLLGMFSKRARSMGVSLGAVSGVFAMFTWGFGHRLGLFEHELGYGWTTVVGFVTTIAVCYIVSAFEPQPDQRKLDFLWQAVMRNKPSTVDSNLE
jgi:SSS family solute:Na+ symporter